MYATIQGLFEFKPRRRSHGFYQLTAFSQHDAFVGISRDLDHLIDLHAPVGPLLPGLGFNGEMIRQLLMEL